MAKKLKLINQIIEILPEDDITTYPRLNFKLRNSNCAVPAGSENPDDGSIASSFKIGGITRYIPKEIIKNKMRDLYEDTYQTMTTVPEGLNLSETTTASKMFEGCEALTTVPQLDTSNIINMGNMFNDCPSLESIAQLNTSSATKMNSMFEGCSSLPEEFPWAIDCKSITNVNNLQSMFKDSSVTKVRLANVSEELKPQITSQLLKGNDNLEIEFVGLVHMDDSNGTMKDLVDPSECKTMTEVPSELDTSNMTTMDHMFEDCEALVTIPEIDTSKVTDMDNMFNNCSSLESVPEMDTTNVTNMSGMFNGCSSIATIPEMDTSNVTNMNNMFNNCSSITGNEEVFSNLDTTKVTNMSGMFTDCTSLTNAPEIDTSNVTNMSSMFEGCTSLPAEFPHRINCSSIEGNNLTEEVGDMFKNSSVTKVQLANVPQEIKSSITPQLLKGDDNLTIEFVEVLDNERTIQNIYSSNYQTITTITDTLDTSKVTNMNSMFKDCSKLISVPQMDTSNVTDMDNMFSNCESIAIIPQINTSKVTNMHNMFNNCISLTTVPQLDTSNVTNTSNMFENTNITTVPQMNTSNVTSMNSMFSGCKNLVTVTQLNTSKANNMSNMFDGCTSLPATLPTIIDCSSIADTNSISNMFKNSSVTKVYLYNVNESLKSSITSSVLKGNDTLEIVFTSSNTSQFYNLTLARTTNQTITLTYIEPGISAVTKTSTTSNQIFTVQNGTTWTATISSATGYNAGSLTASSGTVNANVTVNASTATLKTYAFNITQTTGQTITVAYTSNGTTTNKTSSFTATHFDTWTASLTAATGYNVGTLAASSGTITGAYTLTATAATLKTYTLTLKGTTNQTVTLKYTEPGGSEVIKTSTSSDQSFTVKHGTTWTATIAGASGYNPGTLSASSGTVTGNTTISAGAASFTGLVLTNSNYQMSKVYPSKYKTMTTVPDLLDISNVTYIDYMFSSCWSLTSIPQLNTSNAISMSGMFDRCYALTTIPQLDTSNAINMSSMFGSCKALTSIPQLNTSNVTNMQGMFWGCQSLTTIPQLNTSKVTQAGRLFSETKITTIPLMDFSNATVVEAMFDSCAQLKSIPQINISKATNSSQMFANCTSLTTIPQLDTSNVTEMRNMFENCKSLPSTFPWVINMEKVDTSSGEGYSNMFTGSSVTTVRVRRTTHNLVGSTMKSGGITIKYV